MALLKWIAWILGVAVFVALFVWTSSQTVRGYVTEIVWDRDSTLECTGGIQGDRITLEDETIDTSADPLIFASGGCVLHLVDSNVRAPTAIAASGSAEIVVEGSYIEGEDTAIEVRDGAVVRLIDTEVAGPEHTQDEGRIEREASRRASESP